MLLHQRKYGRQQPTTISIARHETMLYQIVDNEHGVKFIFFKHPKVVSFVVKKQINFQGLRFGDIVDIQLQPQDKSLASLGCRQFAGQIWVKDHKDFLTAITKDFLYPAEVDYFKRVLVGHMGIHRERIIPDDDMPESGYITIPDHESARNGYTFNSRGY